MRRLDSGAQHNHYSQPGLYDPAFEHDACGIGFVVDVKGRKSHAIVRQALTVLNNLDHRGARGSDPHTGDGAGILIQVPYAFLRRVCSDEGIHLPDSDLFGAGMFFLPHERQPRLAIQRQIENIVHDAGQRALGWRVVPTNGSSLGRTARQSEPFICQLFVGAGPHLEKPLAFERKLYVIRKRVENALRRDPQLSGERFFVVSLSHRTLVYKGMLTPQQLVDYYPDLQDERLHSALALVHSRFSTNTFPSWERAHPNRYLIHNGEINTLRGNVNWMRAREALMKSDLFGADLADVLPVRRRQRFGHF